MLDCERVGTGFLSQPVNALSTLAIVAAGVVVLSRPGMRWVGSALIATGIGSFAFHGPMPGWSEWAHDASLAWLIVVVAGYGTGWQRWTQGPGLVGVAVPMVVIAGEAEAFFAVLAVVAVATMLLRDRTWATLGPLLLLGVVAVIGRLGATGGPLCDPDSIWQPHALWHVGAGVAVAWWALAHDGAGSMATRPRFD